MTNYITYKNNSIVEVKKRQEETGIMYGTIISEFTGDVVPFMELNKNGKNVVIVNEKLNEQINLNNIIRKAKTYYGEI